MSDVESVERVIAASRIACVASSTESVNSSRSASVCVIVPSGTRRSRIRASVAGSARADR